MPAQTVQPRLEVFGVAACSRCSVPVSFEIPELAALCAQPLPGHLVQQFSFRLSVAGSSSRQNIFGSFHEPPNRSLHRIVYKRDRKNARVGQREMELNLSLKPAPHLSGTEPRVEERRQVERVHIPRLHLNGDYVLAHITAVAQDDRRSFFASLCDHQVAAPQGGFLLLHVLFWSNKRKLLLFGENLADVRRAIERDAGFYIFCGQYVENTLANCAR